MESELVKNMLKGAANNWDIDPTVRSWFITIDGRLLSDLSHGLILKNNFKTDWDALKQRKVDDKEIEEIFTNRIIHSGGIKIGEPDDFYAITLVLDERAKLALNGFAKSILKTRDLHNKVILIQQKGTGCEEITTTIGEMVRDSFWG